ncbi:MAG: hypothetical protein AAF750_11625 [Planctomycetota bacterium]
MIDMSGFKHGNQYRTPQPWTRARTLSLLFCMLPAFGAVGFAVWWFVVQPPPSSPFIVNLPEGVQHQLHSFNGGGPRYGVTILAARLSESEFVAYAGSLGLQPAEKPYPPDFIERAFTRFQNIKPWWTPSSTPDHLYFYDTGSRITVAQYANGQLFYLHTRTSEL